MPAHKPFILKDEDIPIIDKEIRRRNVPKWKHTRFMILRLLYDGHTYVQIENRLKTNSHTIKQWKDRYLASGLEGLKDLPRPGGKKTPAHLEARVCAMVQRKPPKGYSHWTAVMISQKTGVPERTVNRILKRNNLRPHLHGSFMASNDPEFEKKATDVIGLYMNPPQNAVVLCVDEKTQIQALDRLQPNLPLKQGHIEKRTFEYKRHGITNLFAAFNTASGEITARTKPTRNQNDFISFLNVLDKQYGRQREIHIILDNLSIHKTSKVRDWLESRPNWNFHFTPTYSSWLNQVEIWFSIISRRCIRRGVFNSVRHLISEIKAFIEKYNKNARPFKWSYDQPRHRIAVSNSGGAH